MIGTSANSWLPWAWSQWKWELMTAVTGLSVIAGIEAIRSRALAGVTWESTMTTSSSLTITSALLLNTCAVVWVSQMPFRTSMNRWVSVVVVQSWAHSEPAANTMAAVSTARTVSRRACLMDPPYLLSTIPA